jgi:hypothetical protein
MMTPDQQMEAVMIITALLLAIAIGVIAYLVVSRRREAARRERRAMRSHAPAAATPYPYGAPYHQPFSHPVPIAGLTYDPSHPQYIYAGDVQRFVDLMNRHAEAERAAQSLDRFEAAIRTIKGTPPSPSAKVST